MFQLLLIEVLEGLLLFLYLLTGKKDKAEKLKAKKEKRRLKRKVKLEKKVAAESKQLEKDIAMLDEVQ